MSQMARRVSTRKVPMTASHHPDHHSPPGTPPKSDTKFPISPTSHDAAAEHDAAADESHEVMAAHTDVSGPSGSSSSSGGLAGLETVLEGGLPSDLSASQLASYNSLLGLFASLTDPRPLLEASGSGARPPFPFVASATSSGRILAPAFRNKRN